GAGRGRRTCPAAIAPGSAWIRRARRSPSTRRGPSAMDGILRDVRFALRNMLRSPGLAAVIAISLSLGIGANTAIFSVIRAVMLKSLPVQDPDRLVLMHWHGDAWPKGLNQSGAGGPNNPAYKNASRSMAFPFFRLLTK